MRTYQGPDEFVESFVGAQHEAADSCGTNALLSEKHISHPRHVEVQVSFLYRTIYAVSLNCIHGVLKITPSFLQWLPAFSFVPPTNVFSLI